MKGLTRFTASGPRLLVYCSLFLRRATLTRLTSFFSLATIFSALISTCVILLARAGSHGLDLEIAQKVAGLNSHIIVRPSTAGLPLCDLERLEARLVVHSSVVAMAPYVLVDVVARTPLGHSSPLAVKGIRPDAEGRATDLARYLRSGSLAQVAPKEARGRLPLIMGSGAAAELQLKPGDDLELIRAGGLTSETIDARVVDIFHTGTLNDWQVAYAHLSSIGTFAGLERGCVTALAVKTLSPFTSLAVSDELASLVGDGLTSQDWSALGSDYKAIIEALRQYLDVVIVVIAGLAVSISAGVVLIVLHDKRREIGVLLAMGAEVSHLRYTVGSVGAIVGGVGVVGGGIAAYVLATVLTDRKLLALPDSASISHIPFVLIPAHFVQVAVLQILVPIVVGWLMTADIPKRNLAGVLRDE